MLKRLDIENFRILRDFHAERLGQVNLIVGRNNSGKSTVLEAIRILAGGANRGLLEEISREHDEIFRFLPKSDDIPFQDYFSRADLRDRQNLVIRIGDLREAKNHISIQNVFLREWEDTIKGDNEEYTVHKRLKIENLSELLPNDELRRALQIRKMDRNFYIFTDTAKRMLRTIHKFPSSPCGFVPTRIVSMDELAQAWDGVVFSEDEAFVKEAIRFISPDFEALTFVETEDFEPEGQRTTLLGRRKSRRVPMVKMTGMDGGRPLKSLGDGVARVLQLSLKMLGSRRGYFLIDEFENGIHYTALGKIWNYLFDAAAKLDMQIFATTHSWDCVKSFAESSNLHQNKGTLFRVGQSVRKTDEGRVIATEFSGEALSRIAQSDLEVR